MGLFTVEELQGMKVGRLRGNDWGAKLVPLVHAAVPNVLLLRQSTQTDGILPWCVRLFYIWLNVSLVVNFCVQLTLRATDNKLSICITPLFIKG